MEFNKSNIKGLLLVICGGVAFYCALQNLGAVAGAVRWLLGILSPFLLGSAIAFIFAPLGFGDWRMVTALVSGLTIGGKALGKTVALNKSTSVVYWVGRFLHLFHR